ncbi:DEAD/DEAH box helicase, partial [Caballeronia sp. M23-90]
ESWRPARHSQSAQHRSQRLTRRILALGFRRRSTSFERSHSRQQPVDDFFLKPYVASPASARKAQDEAAAEAERKNTPRQPLAALLGGLGMPRRTPSES